MPNRRRPEPAFTVLLVCTGNICRSALAERLGRAYLREQLGDAAGAIRLVSAGTQGVVGSAMHPDSALVLQGFGAEAGDFVARRLTPSIAKEGDLILTMTRRHRDEVVRHAPRALARTFTLREAADILTVHDPDLDLPGATVAERAGQLVKVMAESRSHRPARDDDVPDPIGGPLDAHAAAGEMIAATLLPVLRRLADLVDAGPLGPVGRTASPAPR